MARMNDAQQHPEGFSRDQIQARQWTALRKHLDHACCRNPFWKNRLQDAGVGPAVIQTWDDFRRLPLTTKAELVADQEANPPYGTNLSRPVEEFSRLHQTSGTTTGTPLRWIDTPTNWKWWMQCWAQLYRILGVTPRDRLAFPFSFGPFIGFWAAFEGATQRGHFCLPGGGMSSEARLKLIADNSATFLCCTPTYALRLAEVAQNIGMNLGESSVRAILVAGEPGGSIPAIRQRIEEAWNARVFDHWGMTEIGPLGIECEAAPGGLHILESECIAEIIDPSSGEPVSTGEEGELVLTNLGRIDSPLFRYRTGDLVVADERPCACGRALLRLKGGILGRADDMLTIRGNNVFPSTMEAILREFDEIAEYRITVTTEHAMDAVKVELEPTASLDADASNALLKKVQTTLKDRLNFQVQLELVSVGSLPRFELKGKRFFRESR